MAAIVSIQPPSDIVLEVARAADPLRAEAMAQRLNSFASGTADAGAGFSAALDQASPAVTPPPAAANLRVRVGVAAMAAEGKRTQAEAQFESVLLNNFIGEMLPKNAPESFGQGFAGDMWRSLLSERIADQIARSGALGIGRRLFATHPMRSGRALVGADPVAAHPNVAAGSGNLLSVRREAAIAEGAVLFASSKDV